MVLRHLPFGQLRPLRMAQVHRLISVVKGHPMRPPFGYYRLASPGTPGVPRGSKYPIFKDSGPKSH